VRKTRLHEGIAYIVQGLVDGESIVVYKYLLFVVQPKSPQIEHVGWYGNDKCFYQTNLFDPW
jgi:hypothetical protein